jgi:alpha-beta hydrolase superfamily lysophospholipase
VQPIIARFDVTDALPAEITQGQDAWITARIFAPSRPRRGRPTVLVCLHGGSYDWRYFHIQGPGLAGYSMAEEMAQRGHVVIVPDQLGVGESARPAAPRKATREVVATANHAAMRLAFDRLREGRLHPRIAPCADPIKVGVGHSMGAMVLVTEQAKFGAYDLTAPLGYTNHGAHLDVGGRSVSIAAPFDDSLPDYRRVNRDLVIRTFHLEDTPDAALAADEAMSVEFLSVLAWEAQHAHTIDDAARIQTPVFLAFGERDVSPEPAAEPAYFSGSDDLTLIRLKGSAHCHNFSPARRRLWRRLDRWIESFGP